MKQLLKIQIIISIFQILGEHKVYIKLKKINVFSHLFTDITKVISIEFSDNFNSSEIGLMNDCFSGYTNLEYIDMSKLNLTKNRCFMNLFYNDTNLEEVIFPTLEFKNIYWFYGMFYGCKKLTYVDMSSVYNNEGEYYYDMFRGCKSLEYINLQNFRKGCSSCNKRNMFLDVPKNATIIIHDNFAKYIEDQLNNFELVFRPNE